MFHGKTKHFMKKFYFLRKVQKKEKVLLIYYKIENQSANILTKAIAKVRYEF